MSEWEIRLNFHGILYLWKVKSMGDLQDPKMEVLYHTRPYFVGRFPYIGLKNTYIGLKNMRLVPPINRFLKWPLIKSQNIYIYIKISYSTSSYILLPMNSLQKMGFILRWHPGSPGSRRLPIQGILWCQCYSLLGLLQPLRQGRRHTWTYDITNKDMDILWIYYGYNYIPYK